MYIHDYYSNCVFIYNFTLIDVNVFLVKMCKIKSFLPFAKFCFYMLLSPITRRLFLRVLFFKVCLDNKKVLGWTVGRWEGRKVETLIFLFPYILRWKWKESRKINLFDRVTTCECWWDLFLIALLCDWSFYMARTRR